MLNQATKAWRRRAAVALICAGVSACHESSRPPVSQAAAMVIDEANAQSAEQQTLTVKNYRQEDRLVWRRLPAPAAGNVSSSP